MWRASVAVIALVLATGTAAAEPRTTPPPIAPIEYDVTSYRTTTMIVDGTSLALLISSLALERANGGDSGASESTFFLGTLGILFATPIVHMGRGHAARGVGSFFMRVGLGTVGAVVGLATYDAGGEYGFVAGGVFGAMGGLAIGAGLDAAFLTKERTPRLRVTPAVTLVAGGGAQLGLGGTF